MASIFKDTETKKYNVQYMVTMPDGTRKKKTKRGFTRRQDAQSWWTANAEAIENGSILKDKMTVAQWLEVYVATYMTHNAESTRTGAQIYFNHFGAHVGTIKLRSLRPDQVQSAVNELAKKYKPSTLETMFSVFKTAINRAEYDGQLSKNPCKHIKLPKAERKKPDYCPKESVSALLAHNTDSKYQIAILLCVFLGLRRGEALGLKWEDIEGDVAHITAQIIRLRPTPLMKDGKAVMKNGKPVKQKGRLIRTELKTDGSVRDLHIPAALQDALKIHRKKQLEERLRLGETYHDEGFICSSHGGGVLSPNGLTHCAKKFLREVGAPEGAHLHTLRHTYGTLLVQAGIPIDVVSELMGHTDVSTTYKFYVGSDDDKKKTASATLDAILTAK